MKKPWFYLFFISVFLFFFLPALDTDLGWHLNYGQYFFNHGRFLTTNQSSLIMPGYWWPNSYSLYQLLVFGLYKNLGLIGLNLANGFVFLAIGWLIFKISRSLAATVLALILITLPGWGILDLGFRAQIFSLLGLTLVYWLLKNWPRHWWWLPLIFWLWANLHGAFILGLGILALFSLFNFKSLKTWLALISSVLTTLINPYGWGIYQEAWRHFNQVRLDQLIAEWVPPSPPYLILASAGFLVSLSLVLKLKKTPYRLSLIIGQLGLLVLTFQARRNLPLYFLSLGLVIAETKFLKKYQRDNNLQAITQAVISLLLVLALVRLPVNLKTSLSQKAFCENHFVAYPCSAVNWFKNNRPAGNIFNMYRWGGFLSWQLPQAKILVDGRMPAWPEPSAKSPYTIFLEILQARPGWSRTLRDKYQIDYLFIPPGTFLDLAIQASSPSDWQEIYRDQRAVIYEKN